MAAALTRATCLGSTKRFSRSLVESHRGIPGGSLSLFVYKPMPVLTVPGVWEETITGSLHSQIILQPDARTAWTLNGSWLYCHIWEDTSGVVMTRHLTNKIEI